MMSAVSSWFAVRVDIITTVIILILTVGCVFIRDYNHPIIVSLMLYYLNSIQNAMIQLSKLYMQTEQQMVSAERCMKLTEIVQEEAIDFKLCPDYLKERPNWPEQGQIQF